MTAKPTTFNTGRDLDPYELRRQIGANILAISGGRIVTIGPSAVLLPAGAGYHVRVVLEADDTYTVERLFVRNGVEHSHGKRTDVYCDDISEVAYYASCFRSYAAGEWERQS